MRFMVQLVSLRNTYAYAVLLHIFWMREYGTMVVLSIVVFLCVCMQECERVGEFGGSESPNSPASPGAGKPTPGPPRKNSVDNHWGQCPRCSCQTTKNRYYT